jgi:hypothetical protein
MDLSVGLWEAAGAPAATARLGASDGVRGVLARWCCQLNDSPHRGAGDAVPEINYHVSGRFLIGTNRTHIIAKSPLHDAAQGGSLNWSGSWRGVSLVAGSGRGDASNTVAPTSRSPVMATKIVASSHKLTHDTRQPHNYFRLSFFSNSTLAPAIQCREPLTLQINRAPSQKVTSEPEVRLPSTTRRVSRVASERFHPATAWRCSPHRSRSPRGVAVPYQAGQPSLAG